VLMVDPPPPLTRPAQDAGSALATSPAPSSPIPPPPSQLRRRNLPSWRHPRFFVSSSQTSSSRRGSLRLPRTRRAASTWTRLPHRLMLRMIQLRRGRHTACNRSRCRDSQSNRGRRTQSRHLISPSPRRRQDRYSKLCGEGKRSSGRACRHLVRNTSSTSHRDFVPSVTKPMDAASSASPTTIAPQPATNLFVASTASTPATGPVIVAAKPPPVISHTCQTQHRESKNLHRFLHYQR